jgi:hypothetical protein
VAIFIIRHGETPGNAARVVQTPETPLSARGVRQAGKQPYTMINGKELCPVLGFVQVPANP